MRAARQVPVISHESGQWCVYPNFEEQKKYTRRSLMKDLAISLVYTGVIVALVKTGIFKPIQSYFQQ